MSRVFKTRSFNRWARKSDLSDVALSGAVDEMARGLIDADLGGHIVKKRIPLPGRGKRGSSRTLVGTNFKDCWFFLYGFGKNERDNIDDKELAVLQGIVKALLVLKDTQVNAAIRDGSLLEVKYDNETQEPHP